MIKFVLLLLPVFLGVFVFVYFFLRRSLRAFSLDTSNIKVKIALIAISLALTLLSFNISSMLTVFLLHLMGIDLFLRLVVFIFNKFIKPKETKIFNNLKKIYKSGIVSILAVAVLLVFGYFNLQNVKATEYSISTNKDIRDEGYRVLLIADMHYGVSLDFDELTRKCAEMSEFDPDIVVLCGDIVDNGTSPEEMQALFKALGGIKSKYGIFYVYGNHDRSMRLLESEFGDDDLQKAITDNGIKILRDEVITLNDEFTVVGREDRSRERKTVFELQKDIDENDYVLVLDHQPSE
ncbi:MAG: metallophosphoesterase, partial [Clostridia bacterium]|nr:metallophosphoesterase [Clostridia bacterium]